MFQRGYFSSSSTLWLSSSSLSKIHDDVINSNDVKKKTSELVKPRLFSLILSRLPQYLCGVHPGGVLRRVHGGEERAADRAGKEDRGTQPVCGKVSVHSRALSQIPVFSFSQEYSVLNQ